MAKEVNWIDINGRNYLKDVLPLDTPYSIQVEAITACNFRCNYCSYSSKNIKPTILSIEILKNALSSLDKFSNKLKKIIFAGLGEPLLNKNIYDMIDISRNYTETTTLLTNGALLNKNNIDKLLNTCINEIRISMQGISEEDYYKICGYKINIKEFVDNIEYLYKNRRNTKIALKIADIAINTEEKQKNFFELFEDKADYLIIQKISPLHDSVNYKNIVKDLSKGMYFETKSDSKICPQIFFSMQLLSNGNVTPCCSLNEGTPIIGNINNSNLYDIWNGTKLKELRLEMLKGNISNIKYCRNCSYLKYTYNKYDDIDEYAEELLKKYE